MSKQYEKEYSMGSRNYPLLGDSSKSGLIRGGGVSVSVIIPCYNQASFLVDCLDSVLRQTFVNWECIILDDGSTDDSKTIAQDYCKRDERFKYYYQDNQGAPAARNNGIGHSIGTYILPLDADDIIACSYLDKAVRIIANPNVKLVYSLGALFGEENKEWSLPQYSYESFIWNNCIPCTALFRRADFDRTKGYNPNMRKGLNDWDFWLSFIEPSDIVYCINEILFFYRKHGESLTSSAMRNRKELCRQLYYNHTSIYERYASDVLFYRNSFDEAIYYKELEVRGSLSYRLGCFLLAPFKIVKDKFLYSKTRD